jgi:hypothetical protein
MRGKLRYLQDCLRFIHLTIPACAVLGFLDGNLGRFLVACVDQLAQLCTNMQHFAIKGAVADAHLETAGSLYCSSTLHQTYSSCTKQRG